jgi:hypothetical protein
MIQKFFIKKELLKIIKMMGNDDYGEMIRKGRVEFETQRRKIKNKK